MQLGTAFIELLPDLSGFAKATTDGVKKAQPKPVEVEVKPDLGDLAKDVATGVKKVSPPAVEFPVYADFKAAGDGAKEAGEKAGREFSDGFDKTAESSTEAGSGLDSVASKADGLATRASIAAGGIGDLAGALEANGVISEEMASKAELVSSTIMGVAGVADLGVIAMEGLKALQASDIIQKGVMIGQNIALKAAQVAGTIATGAQAAAQWALNAAMSANPIGIVVVLLAALVGAIILAWNKSETFRKIVLTVWAAIQTAIKFAWEKVIKPVLDFLVRFFTVTIPNALRTFLAANDRVVKGVAGAIRSFWVDRVKPILDRVVGFFTVTIPNAWNRFRDAGARVFQAVAGTIRSFWNDRVKPIVDGIRTFFTSTLPGAFNSFRDKGVAAFKSFRDKIGGFLNDVKSKAMIPVNFVIESVYNNGIRTLINKVIGVFGGTELPRVDPIKMATGGVLPGWSPGRDIHRFVSPTGGVLDLSGGEAVMRPEFTKLFGSKGIETMNRLARSGNMAGIAALLGGHQAHANGGLVSFKGGTFTEPFAAVLRQLNAISPFYLFQGGWRPQTSYSGTSHQGDAIDIGPVSADLVRAARSLGIAAWDRTGMGNWAPHIHGVPLPGVGTALGSAIWQAQDYLRGGNGLGGRDNGLGSGSQPNPGGGFNPLAIADLIASVPGVLSNIQAGFAQMVSDTGFGRLLRDAVSSIGGDVVNWANEKIPGPGPLPGFANGGVAVKGGWAQVGERGPETVWLPGGSYVSPNGAGLRIVDGVVRLDLANSEAHLRLLIGDENGHDAAFAATLGRMGGDN